MFFLAVDCFFGPLMDQVRAENLVEEISLTVEPPQCIFTQFYKYLFSILFAPAVFRHLGYGSEQKKI